MKLFFLILGFFLCLLGNAQRDQSMMKKHNVFQHVDSKGRKELIKLFYTNDSVTSGIYLGNFYDRKLGVIHYKSAFENTPERGGYGIVFELKNLVLSRDILHFSNESNQKLLSPDSINSEQAKFYFGSRIHFLGDLNGEHLILQKTSAKNIASSAEKLVFTKQ